MNRYVFEQLGLPVTGSKDITLKTAGENRMKGYVVHHVPLALGNKQFSWDIVVAPITDSLILGLDFLLSSNSVIDLENNVLKIDGTYIPASVKRNNDGQEIGVCRVILSRTTKIPANFCKLVSVTLDNTVDDTDYVLDPVEVHPHVALPSAVVKGGTTASLYIANFSDKAVKLNANQLIGCATPCVVQTYDSEGANGYDSPPTSYVESDEDSHCEEHMASVRSVQVAAEVHQRFQELCTQMPDHLKDLFERSCVNLKEEERVQVGELLLEFQDAFAKHDLDLGHFESIQHTIDTGDAKPRRQRMRRTPLGFQKEEKEHLQAMLDQGVIEPSNSDWASAPVLVRKRDGSLRYCIDYRDLNDCTVKDAFPLPLIEECLDMLFGNLFMSSLDLASGYWQISVHPKDRHKTAFITKYGLWQMVRMAFGLCNAPSTFQRVMNLVLRGLTWNKVLVYLDDVMVLGQSFDSHLENLREVFSRFQENNLKLKPRKCHLFKTEVEFLGKKVSRDGVSITEAKVKAVIDWPKPTDKEKV